MYSTNVILILHIIICAILSEIVFSKEKKFSRTLTPDKNTHKYNQLDLYGAGYVDLKIQDGMGSGMHPYSNINDDEDAFASGYGFNDEEEDIGSGYYSTHAQNCLFLRNEIVSKGLTGVYLPECTKDGNFKPRQCHKTINTCWCVDKQGREVENTRRNNPGMVNCQGPLVVPPTKRRKPNERKDEIIEVQPSDGFGKDDDFDIGEIIIEPTDQLSNHINQLNNENGGVKVDIKPLDPEKNSVEHRKGTDNIGTSLTPMMPPGMLAVIIGGTVVGLLCAVLLVMFIVYRMRKKDEGSYALEEPKRSPSLHMYSRAPAKEFYA